MGEREDLIQLLGLAYVECGPELSGRIRDYLALLGVDLPPQATTEGYQALNPPA